MLMDRKKAIDSSKKAVTVFFKIRRGFKIYIAFITGILSGIEIYKQFYPITESRVIAVIFGILFGAFITAVMLLILEVIRKCVGIAKAKGMKLFEKFKERKSANEADKKEE
jgi:hypothetical protein